MPKPMNDSDGCGMHLKMTLMDLEGNNILSDPADSYGLSELGYHFMAGIMETNPDNSPVCVDLRPVFHLD